MIKRKGLGLVDCLLLGVIFVYFVLPFISVKSAKVKNFALYNYQGKIIRQWNGHFKVDWDSDGFYFTHNGQRNIVRGGIVIIERAEESADAKS